MGICEGKCPIVFSEYSSVDSSLNSTRRYYTGVPHRDWHVLHTRGAKQACGLLVCVMVYSSADAMMVIEWHAIYQS